MVVHSTYSDERSVLSNWECLGHQKMYNLPYFFANMLSVCSRIYIEPLDAHLTAYIDAMTAPVIEGNPS